ncbi:MAG: sigma-70 family RNA polymerase sigma factor [Bacteroidia bacterium]|nr:sigma-70 family RNA polymerase sigma factor [Bacteroidia bacterium]
MNTTPAINLMMKDAPRINSLTDAGMLYNTYFHHILKMVRRYYPCNEASKDLAMDIFMKILFNLDKFNEMGYGIKPWILKITRNEIMQNFRKEKHARKIVNADVSELYSIPCQPPEENPMDEIITNEWPLIKNILLNMDEKQYRLIHLRFFCRKPYKEIAAILGITENNAKVKLNRLIRRIRLEYQMLKRRNRKTA